MNLLLDTNTSLWGLTDASKLSQHVRKVLPKADTWLSVASVWEILIKQQSGRLPLPQPVGPWLTAKLAFNGVKLLPIMPAHVLRIESLPLYHRDPFDRMLIAQSLEQKFPLVSADAEFQRYDVEVIW